MFVVPIEIRCLKRRDARIAGGSCYPLGQTPSDRKTRSRPAAGAADHDEPLDAEFVRDRGNVGDAVHDPSAAVAVAETPVAPPGRSSVITRAPTSA